jgi:hypothetical protein
MDPILDFVFIEWVFGRRIGSEQTQVTIQSGGFDAGRAAISRTKSANPGAVARRLRKMAWQVRPVLRWSHRILCGAQENTQQSGRGESGALQWLGTELEKRGISAMP